MIRQAVEYSKREVIANDIANLEARVVPAFMTGAIIIALILRPVADRSAAEGLGEFVGLVAWELLILMEIGGMALVARRKDSLQRVVAIILTLAVPLLAYVGRSSLEPKDHGWKELFTGIIYAGLVIVLGLMSALISAYVILAACDRYQDSLPPDERCWVQLARISHEYSMGATRGLAARRRVIEQLEVASSVLLEIPYSLGIDTQVPSIVVNRFATASAHVRGLTTWIALPQFGTGESLRAELHHLIVILLNGEFHNLPQLGEASSDRIRSASIRQVSVRLFVGILPIAALICTEIAHIGVEAEIRSTWLLAAIAWLAVSLITVLDPNFSENLSRTEKVIGLLRGKQD